MKRVDKRFLGLFLLGILLLSLVVGSIEVVSAFDATKIAEDIGTHLETYYQPIAEFLFGKVDGDSTAEELQDLLLVKTLFFFVMLVLVYYGLRHIPSLGESTLLVWIGSLAFSVILIRYLGTEQMIKFIWLPSGALGIIFATLFPFILFFFFIESLDSRIIRKVGWTAFALVHAMLALVRWEELALPQTTVDKLPTWMQGFANLGWVYILVIVLSVFIMLIDKRVRAMLIDARALELRRGQVAVKVAKLEEKKREAQDAADSSNSKRNQRAAAKRAREIQDQIDRIQRDVV